MRPRRQALGGEGMTISIVDVAGFLLVIFAWLAIGFWGIFLFSYPRDIEVKHCIGGFSVSTAILLLVVATAKGYVHWTL